jgi:hypothetical protein
MNIVNKTSKYLHYFFTNIFDNKQRKNIFVFSHKRGRTTLLSHILATHPQICGYRELHCKYTNKLDLIRTKVALYEDQEAFLKADYLLDKILHNEWLFKEDLFDEADNLYLFILRQPEATMLSMIKRHIQNNDIDTVNMQSTYYIARLRELRRYWLELKSPKLAIDSDEILFDSENILEKISRFLGLKSPLTPEYDTFEKTGVAGAGDMSVNISSGKLNQNKIVMVESDKALLGHVDMNKIRIEFNLTYKLLFAKENS